MPPATALCCFRCMGVRRRGQRLKALQPQPQRQPAQAMRKLGLSCYANPWGVCAAFLQLLQCPHSRVRVGGHHTPAFSFLVLDSARPHPVFPLSEGAVGQFPYPTSFFLQSIPTRQRVEEWDGMGPAIRAWVLQHGAEQEDGIQHEVIIIDRAKAQVPGIAGNGRRADK